MPTMTQARDIIVTHLHSVLQTHLPTLTVFYENTTHVDVNAVGDIFLQAEIDFEGNYLASVSDDLIDQVVGFIGLRLFIKDGKGTRTGLQVFDTLNANLRQQQLGTIRTGSTVLGKKISQDGWLSLELGVPFEYHT